MLHGYMYRTMDSFEFTLFSNGMEALNNFYMEIADDPRGLELEHYYLDFQKSNFRTHRF